MHLLALTAHQDATAGEAREAEAILDRTRARERAIYDAIAADLGAPIPDRVAVRQLSDGHYLVEEPAQPDGEQEDSQ